MICCRWRRPDCLVFRRGTCHLERERVGELWGLSILTATCVVMGWVLNRQRVCIHSLVVRAKSSEIMGKLFRKYTYHYICMFSFRDKTNIINGYLMIIFYVNYHYSFYMNFNLFGFTLPKRTTTIIISEGLKVISEKATCCPCELVDCCCRLNLGDWTSVYDIPNNVIYFNLSISFCNLMVYKL